MLPSPSRGDSVAAPLSIRAGGLRTLNYPDLRVPSVRPGLRRGFGAAVVCLPSAATRGNASEAARACVASVTDAVPQATTTAEKPPLGLATCSNGRERGAGGRAR